MLIARMNAQDPQLLIEIRIGSSADLLQSFDRRELDTVIVRLHAGRTDGEILTEENSAGSPRRAGGIARMSLCRRSSRLPSPAACARWPAGFSTRRACPGPKFSSAAASRRSPQPSWPGSARRPGAAHAAVRRHRRGPQARPSRLAVLAGSAALKGQGGSGARCAGGAFGSLQARGARLANARGAGQNCGRHSAASNPAPARRKRVGSTGSPSTRTS